MIASWKMQKADSPSLKRSFGLVAGSGTESPKEYSEWGPHEPSFVEANEVTNNPPIPIPSKRRSLSSGSRSSSMPVQTSPPSFPVSFPSFMSVFGTGSSMRGGNMREENAHASAHTSAHTYGSRQQNYASHKSSDSHYPLPFPHRESISSTNSESTDSSPTTTISTFDSGSVTDTTPSSSPESPTSVIPLSGFKSMMSEGKGHSSDESRQDATSKPLPQLPLQMDIDSPEKKPRNTKNLSVTTSSTDQVSPITSFAASPPTDGPSQPVSPLFASPPKIAPRNRFNLSIRTPGIEKTSFLPPTAPTPSLVPPTPATLRRPPIQHYPSEPSLSIFSPSAAPLGGMQLPPFAQHGEQKFSERLSQSLHDLKEEDPSYDLPESQEKKEDGYPNGPVCIYDSGVYLYLEPSREEASKFDCVINVAKEVLCPFISASDSKGKESTITSVMRHGHAEFDRHAISEPQTAVSEFSFKSAFEYQPLESPSTPTTPKPEKAAPEYVHIPWDHNSDIVEDAYLLCKIIDKRVNDGKKVLVHCQLGVSRSASLIIAYGMYKNSSLDFSMAYEHVKSRSQWISPNMTLIYQLTEFRNKLNIGAFEANPRSAPSEWFKFGEAVRTPKAIPLEVAQESESASSKTVNRSKPLPPIPKFDQVMTDSFSSSSASSTGALTPTPSTTSSATQTDPSPFIPRPFLLRERASAVRPLNLSLPPRPEYGIEMDLVANDVPESPSMFSPRAAEFTASPFHRTAAGDLALHRVETVALPEEEDPRSPPQHGDASITRSIDEFL